MENKTNNIKYNKTNLENMYLKPKWYFFIPLIGFFMYLKEMSIFGKEAGLYDRKTPGGEYINKIVDQFFLYTNILIIPCCLFVAILFNFMFWFWKVKSLKALELNKDFY